MSLPTTPIDIARRFDTGSPLHSVAPMGEGLINDSYRVECQEHRYLLQRINTHVFSEPEKVMQNIARVTGHLAAKAQQTWGGDWQRHVLTITPGLDGDIIQQDEAGNYWRMYHFIENSTTIQSVTDPSSAYSAAQAFGRFVQELSDLPEPPLHETIIDFHNTPARLDQLETAIERQACNCPTEADKTIERLLSHRNLAPILNTAGLPLRTVHNDTKINNILFDSDTAAALCVVDLDTVMPGLALHDFADLVRSASMVTNAGKPLTNLQIYEALLKGWINGVGDMLSREERSLLWIAPQVITLELAMRFLTDHLEGNHYFKVNQPGQNLERTIEQLDLLESMQSHERTMKKLSI
ncbi:MAG: aminoglycoside phosphotransferase family protein [Candidatus Sedimenticola sp. 20ELBAFRAG]